MLWDWGILSLLFLAGLWGQFSLSLFSLCLALSLLSLHPQELTYAISYGATNKLLDE